MGHQVEQKKSSTASRSGKPAPFFGKAALQAKLTVNAPGDRYEREADAVADKVMRMQDISDRPLQRKCAHCEEEDKLQMKRETPGIQRKCASCEEEVKKNLQRKPIANDIESSLQSSKGQGRSLPNNTRSWMESRFGTDFSGVNIHTGTKAVQLSRELNAQAFTHGSDIYFNEGKFAPETAGGKRLLAHELTHVVQQGGESNVGTQNVQCAAAAAAGAVTIGAVLAWCLSGAAVSVVIDQIMQSIKWWTSGKVKQNWCRTLFNALFGCAFGMVAGAIRTMIFSKIAAFTIAELSLWIKQRLIAAGYTWLAWKWGVTIALLGCDESQEKL